MNPSATRGKSNAAASVQFGGTAQVLAAFGIWAKTRSVRWFGVTVAGFNAIARLLFIPAYPFCR
jgi:hypothetical protein